MSKVSEYMIRKLTEILDEADALETAVWGGIPNTKIQSVLDRRKETLTQDIDKLIRFLMQRKQEISTLRMDGEDRE